MLINRGAVAPQASVRHAVAHVDGRYQGPALEAGDGVAPAPPEIGPVWEFPESATPGCSHATVGDPVQVLDVGGVHLIRRLARAIDAQREQALTDGAPGRRIMALDEASHALHRAAIALRGSLVVSARVARDDDLDGSEMTVARAYRRPRT